MVKEGLEQVDWDNPDASWGPNDQENWENEQTQQPEMSFNEKLVMVDDMFHAINAFLEGGGRKLVRVPQGKLDNLLLQIIELSQPKTKLNEMAKGRFPGRWSPMAQAAHQKHYKEPVRRTSSEPTVDDRTKEQKDKAAWAAAEGWAQKMAGFYSPEQLEIEKEKVYQTLRTNI